MTRDEMAQIADAHDTKAAKVRALNEAGVSTTEISDFLEIRYQHTYNVLLRAKRIGRTLPSAPATGEIMALVVDRSGSISLPDNILEAFDLRDGGQLFVRQTADGLVLMPRDVAIAELQRTAAERMPEHANLLAVLLQQQPTDVPSTP